MRAQARVAGARIVHRKADVAELRESVADESVVVDRHVLGQLEYERSGRSLDELAEPSVAMQDEAGRQVDRKERVSRQSCPPSSAARIVVSSKSGPRPMPPASASRTSGRVPSWKRVSASKPTVAPVSNSTIGWKTG